MTLATDVRWGNPTSETPPTTEAFLYAHSLGGVDMKNNIRRPGDRRLSGGTPSFPLECSNGVTIMECRRKIPDRRINDIQVEWLDETVIALGVTEP